MRAGSKLTPEQRAELLVLHLSGDIEASKALAIKFGVSQYYGAVLAFRKVKPRKKKENKRWTRANTKGPVLA